MAEKLGVFWQRRDLCQLHQHWLRDNPNITGLRHAAKLAGGRVGLSQWAGAIRGAQAAWISGK